MKYLYFIAGVIICVSGIVKVLFSHGNDGTIALGLVLLVIGIPTLVWNYMEINN